MGLELKKSAGRHTKELCKSLYEKCHFNLKKPTTQTLYQLFITAKNSFSIAN